MMNYEERVVAAYSTPGLKRNQLTRAAKKLMMEFDARYSGMSQIERDAFLEQMFPEEVSRDGENLFSSDPNFGLPRHSKIIHS